MFVEAVLRGTTLQPRVFVVAQLANMLDYARMMLVEPPSEVAQEELGSNLISWRAAVVSLLISAQVSSEDLARFDQEEELSKAIEVLEVVLLWLDLWGLHWQNQSNPVISLTTLSPNKEAGFGVFSITSETR